jgi:aryl-alcohol dehydrogenase-like predicted oxidoreductase
MGMSAFYGERDDAQSAKTLRRALDLGVSHFDTAYAYGLGHNEELIANAIGDRKDEFILATKFAQREAPDGTRTIDSSGAWARQSAENALKRLKFDTLDLFYMHRRNPATPIEETVGTLGELVQEGKIRWIGLSEVSPATLRAAHAVHPISAVQMEYSLFTRDVEGEMLDTCRELGVALVAYSPVGRGMLTGKIDLSKLAGDDFRRALPRFTGDNYDRNAAMVAAVTEVAGQIGCTPAQAALAWLLAQGDEVLPIPGTRRISYLEENLAAADVSLSPEQIAALSEAVPETAGERYMPEGMKSTWQ